MRTSQAHCTSLDCPWLQIFCIILFLAGSITFATVITQLNEMLTDLNRETVFLLSFFQIV